MAPRHAARQWSRYPRPFRRSPPFRGGKAVVVLGGAAIVWMRRGRRGRIFQKTEGEFPVETQVRTPQMVFMQPQRLVVPLFQRPYVWNEENQWDPLWDDVVRVADRVLTRPGDRHHPHFLGAVVLQQVQKQTGQMQE